MIRHTSVWRSLKNLKDIFFRRAKTRVSPRPHAPVNRATRIKPEHPIFSHNRMGIDATTPISSPGVGANFPTTASVIAARTAAAHATTNAFVLEAEKAWANSLIAKAFMATVTAFGFYGYVLEELDKNWQFIKELGCLKASKYADALEEHIVNRMLELKLSGKYSGLSHAGLWEIACKQILPHSVIFYDEVGVPPKVESGIKFYTRFKNSLKACDQLTLRLHDVPSGTSSGPQSFFAKAYQTFTQKFIHSPVNHEAAKAKPLLVSVVPSREELNTFSITGKLFSQEEQLANAIVEKAKADGADISVNVVKLSLEDIQLLEGIQEGIDHEMDKLAQTKGLLAETQKSLDQNTSGASGSGASLGQVNTLQRKLPDSTDSMLVGGGADVVEFNALVAFYSWVGKISVGSSLAFFTGWISKILFLWCWLEITTATLVVFERMFGYKPEYTQHSSECRTTAIYALRLVAFLQALFFLGH